MTLPPAVLWVDPGKMTGLAYLATGMMNGQGYVFQADEFEFDTACDHIEKTLVRHEDFGLAIGWERFDINDKTHKKTQAGIKDALHVIGVCRYLTGKYHCRFLGEAHQHTPDKSDQARLKALDWWVPGKNDAQSAAAHMLAWLVKENELIPAWRDRLYTQE